MQFAANLRPPKKLDLRRVRGAPFSRPDGSLVEAHHPLTKAALLLLERCYPDSLPLPELARLAGREVAAAGGDGRADEVGDLVSELFSLVVVGAVELLRRRRQLPGPTGSAPVASALARAQLDSGQRRLATRLHSVLAVDEFATRLLGQLDGQRGTDDLVGFLLAALAEGRLRLDGVAASTVREPRTRELVRRNVARLLDSFVRAGIVASTG
jgi:hypothetical protein